MLVTKNSSWEEESRPATKTKLDAMDVESDCGPIKLDIPLHVDNINGAVLDVVVSVDMDHGLGDLDNLNIDDYGGTDSLDVPTFCSDLSTNVSPVADISTISPASMHGSLFNICSI